MSPVRAFLLALFSFEGKLAFGDVNVYDEPMTDCGPANGAGCTYEAMDVGAHEVCVTQLPHGFSSDTGQGPWSDQFTGQPWCICIWAYSNYILQHKDLSLKCKSIPSKVLEEKYSLDKFKQCGSMSSTEGCGPEDIRRSIESLCQQCDQEAPDSASKTALKTKCDAILSTAPAAPLQRLYSEDASNAKGIFSFQSKPDMSRFASGIFGLAIAGVSVGVVVRAFRNRRSIAGLQDDAEQPISQDSAAEEREDVFAREALIS